MTHKRSCRLRRIFDILLCLTITIAGICLICSCLSIYYSGEHSYSRETVAKTFNYIAIPIYIALFFTISSFIVDFFAHEEAKKHPSKKDYKNVIKLLAAKKDLGNCDDTLTSSIAKEIKLRKKHSLLRTILLCLASVVFLSYALNANNFHQSEINDSMIKAMLVLLPCFAVSFAYSVYVAYSNEKSFQRELDLIKKAPASNNRASDESNANKSEKAVVISKIIILLLSFAVIIYGLVAGGTADVLTKAINICTECIGLG